MSIKTHFQNISEPRVLGRTKHKLIDIIGITIIALIAECDEWQDIVDWARSKEKHLREYFELPNGIPSHDTFERVFSIINPTEFERCFIAWVKSIFGNDNRYIHVDGKSIKGSRDESKGKKMLHIVHAWSSSNSVLLGQFKTDEKSNEITAIPELLKMLDIKGCVITIDAMGCQHQIAEQIVEQGADYILAVKDNQKELSEQIQTAFEHQAIQSKNETIEKDHGRIETRTCKAITNLELIDATQKWKDCKSIVEVTRIREIKNVATKEKSYYISSLATDASDMNLGIRKHWSVENELHWTLDVTFKEDKSRKRKENEGQNFSLCRKIALNVVKSYDGDKRSIKRRRKMSSYDFEYLKNLVKI
ncbi:MAG: ISAs1 family transposase [Ferruginibacter sp.]